MPVARPKLHNVRPDDPLRLDVAAALAYPDGSMTVSGLRKEAGKGRLIIERTAGKDYTTLAEIQRMREKCRVEAKERDSGSARRNTTVPANSPTRLSGSSKMVDTERALAALQMTLAEPSEPSKRTSMRNTRPRRKPGNVHQLPSPSRMS
jgi:hypothetical protein